MRSVHASGSVAVNRLRAMSLSFFLSLCLALSLSIVFYLAYSHTHPVLSHLSLSISLFLSFSHFLAGKAWWSSGYEPCPSLSLFLLLPLALLLSSSLTLPHTHTLSLFPLSLYLSFSHFLPGEAWRSTGYEPYPSLPLTPLLGIHLATSRPGVKESCAVAVTVARGWTKSRLELTILRVDRIGPGV